ncbi:hypothetical protein C8J57DRAFT_1711684 [Mycena rebaudengoi]|nr:hypothetical protein C8J57DRAFT_1711684 [Mycena rebaudengoi]
MCATGVHPSPTTVRVRAGVAPARTRTHTPATAPHPHLRRRRPHHPHPPPPLPRAPHAVPRRTRRARACNHSARPLEGTHTRTALPATPFDFCGTLEPQSPRPKPIPRRAPRPPRAVAGDAVDADLPFGRAAGGWGVSRRKFPSRAARAGGRTRCQPTAEPITQLAKGKQRVGRPDSKTPYPIQKALVVAGVVRLVSLQPKNWEANPGPII